MSHLSNQLQTNRLQLRPFHQSDVTAIAALCNNYNLYKTTLNLPYPYTEEHAKFWVNSHAEKREQKTAFEFAIVRKDDNVLMGAIGLFHNSANQLAEIGYWLGEVYWNHGYVSEATQAVIRFGFEELKLHKIYARHLEMNPASGKVMLKTNMKYEGTLREHIVKEGKHHNLLYYGILKSEYKL